MVDISEAIALRLREFIQVAEKKAGNYSPPGVRSVMRGNAAQKPRILEIYEECLSKLEVDERGEFDRMIKKMSGAFGSPPGALIPQ